MKRRDATANKPNGEALAATALLAGATDPAPEKQPASHESDTDGLDVVAKIVSVNKGRDPALLMKKFDLISTDSFAFLRASAVIGHAALDLSSVPATPVAWLTGDLHVENFGTFKGENGLVYFDLNDFDEAARLPLAVDLVRLLSSMVAASRSLGLESAARRKMLQTVLTRAGAVFAKGKPVWLERETARGTVRVLIAQAAGRRRRDMLAKLTKGSGDKRRFKIDGAHLLAFDSVQGRFSSKAIEQAVEAHSKERQDEFEILDIAVRVAGKGSLGLPRYALLVRRPNRRQPYLLDLKYAAPSSAAARFGLQQPDLSSEAGRIVSIQEMCQTVSPAGLSACMVEGESFVLRSLQPQEDKVDLTILAKDPAALTELFARMAEIHAAGVLRSAGRGGSAGPDDVIAFGQGLAAASQQWIEAAIDVESDIRSAFKEFRTAWKDRDPRLVALTRPAPGTSPPPSSKPASAAKSKAGKAH